MGETKIHLSFSQFYSFNHYFFFIAIFLIYVDPCTRPLDEGDECTDDSEPDATTRYYYDSEDNSCKEFEYTGCGGNTNRFRSLGYCQRRCVDREEEDSESSGE